MFNDQRISLHNRRKQAHFLNLLVMLVNALVKSRPQGWHGPLQGPRCPLEYHFSQCPLRNALLSQARRDRGLTLRQLARCFLHKSNFPVVSIVAASLSNCTSQERPISIWGPACFQGTGFCAQFWLWNRDLS